jgi:hypothetical protein
VAEAAIPSDLSPALIGRERGLALAGRASRQNSATAEAACKQHAIACSIQSPLAQWDKSLGLVRLYKRRRRRPPAASPAPLGLWRPPRPLGEPGGKFPAVPGVKRALGTSQTPLLRNDSLSNAAATAVSPPAGPAGCLGGPLPPVLRGFRSSAATRLPRPLCGGMARAARRRLRGRRREPVDLPVGEREPAALRLERRGLRERVLLPRQVVQEPHDAHRLVRRCMASAAVHLA